jgi:nucleotide-binding universal stress UspA family protein
MMLQTIGTAATAKGPANRAEAVAPGSWPRAVLVPLDGSELAEQALAVGAARARRTGAALHLVTVHEPWPALALPPDFPVARTDLEERVGEELRQYVESVAAATRAFLPSQVTATTLTGGVAEALCGFVETHGVDLVVMTTHGRGGLSRLWLGSVADRLLRRVGVPVLLLHPSDAPQPTQFHQLLVALDGEIEQPVLDAALALGGPESTTWTLARVVEPAVPVLSGLAARPTHLPPDWNARRETEARNYLARLAERLAGAGHAVDWRVHVGRGVAGQLLELADATRADCIVVGTHGARGMERALLGSVADKVVRGARVPVLVAPARHH